MFATSPVVVSNLSRRGGDGGDGSTIVLDKRVYFYNKGVVKRLEYFSGTVPPQMPDTRPDMRQYNAVTVNPEYSNARI